MIFLGIMSKIYGSELKKESQGEITQRQQAVRTSEERTGIDFLRILVELAMMSNGQIVFSVFD